MQPFTRAVRSGKRFRPLWKGGIMRDVFTGKDSSNSVHVRRCIKNIDGEKGCRMLRSSLALARWSAGCAPSSAQHHRKPTSCRLADHLLRTQAGCAIRKHAGVAGAGCRSRDEQERGAREANGHRPAGDRADEREVNCYARGLLLVRPDSGSRIARSRCRVKRSVLAISKIIHHC